MAKANEGPSRTETDSMGPIEVGADRYMKQLAYDLSALTPAAQRLSGPASGGAACASRRATAASSDCGPAWAGSPDPRPTLRSIRRHARRRHFWAWREPWRSPCQRAGSAAWMPAW